MKRLPESERRILKSDQRGGKNIPELAIGFDRATGWFEVRGTMEEAEIEETEPKIIEFLQTQDTPVAERMILGALNIRAMIVSKALRRLFKNNVIERAGKGRKGDPFLYSLSSTLMDDSLNSLPEGGGMGEETPGRELEEGQKGLANTTQMVFPGSREENGKSTEENAKTDTPGRESGPTDEWEEFRR